MTRPYDVVVLAGGRAQRLGGEDKIVMDVGGRLMIDRVLDGCAAASRVVLVGPERPLAPRSAPVDIVWCLEDPPGAGPLAAVAAAFPYLRSEIVVLVGGDMPFAGRLVAELAGTAAAGAAVHPANPAAPPGFDGAVAVGADELPQPLACALLRDSLKRRLAEIGDPANRPLRMLLDDLRLAVVPDDTHQTIDVDAPADLEVARAIAHRWETPSPA